MVCAIIFSIIIIAYLSSPRPAKPITYLPFNPNKIYLKPADWKGVPIDRKNRFVNYTYPFYQNYLIIMYWFPSHFLNLIRNTNKRFPVQYYGNNQFLHNDETIIWLGHASFFLRIQEINILIDPQFYNTSFYKRHTDNPISPERFTSINYILLSHDHADHCDKKSLQLLVKNNPKAIILTGLKMDLLLQLFFNKKVNIVNAEWYEKFLIETQIEIYFVPSRHYSKRLFKKYNSTLWGGFIIKFKNKQLNSYQTIYFGGDSGYGTHFADIKNLFSPDITILGIGAFMPKWFMHPNHMSPEDAIKAAKDLDAKVMIPMHYETFNLSNEKMETPLRSLKEHSGSQNIKPLVPGEIYILMDF